MFQSDSNASRHPNLIVIIADLIGPSTILTPVPGTMFDLALYSMMREEPNVTLLLNTWLVAVVMDSPRRIQTAIAECQSSQLRYLIDAKVFVDATGDGRLGATLALTLAPRVCWR